MDLALAFHWQPRGHGTAGRLRPLPTRAAEFLRRR